MTDLIQFDSPDPNERVLFQEEPSAIMVGEEDKEQETMGDKEQEIIENKEEETPIIVKEHVQEITTPLTQTS